MPKGVRKPKPQNQEVRFALTTFFGSSEREIQRIDLDGKVQILKIDLSEKDKLQSLIENLS